LTPHRAVAARKTMMSDYGITEPLTMVRAEAWTGFFCVAKKATYASNQNASG
jgi:hypothetical protein